LDTGRAPARAKRRPPVTQSYPFGNGSLNQGWVHPSARAELSKLRQAGKRPPAHEPWRNADLRIRASGTWDVGGWTALHRQIAADALAPPRGPTAAAGRIVDVTPASAERGVPDAAGPFPGHVGL